MKYMGVAKITIYNIEMYAGDGYMYDQEDDEKDGTTCDLEVDNGQCGVSAFGVQTRPIMKTVCALVRSVE